MKRSVVVVTLLALVLLGLSFRITHTPHGRMDLGPALLSRLMAFIPTEVTPEARAGANAFTARMMGSAPAGIEIVDLEFPGPAGPLPMRLYRPVTRMDEEEPIRRGVVAWVHGGGFWMGDELEKWDGPCGRLALAADAIVASIGYRLAPEDPYPAAVDDTWAGLRYVASHAQGWGGRSGQLVVSGGSAGGNLAAVLALRARDAGRPALLLQALTVPALNAGGPPTESMRNFSQGYGLDGIDAMHRAYLPETVDAREPFASPLLAPDLAGVAPAVIHTAEFDPLRDEGERYAARLEAAGVPVELVRFDGTIHGFLGSPAKMARAEALMAEAIRRAFDDASRR